MEGNYDLNSWKQPNQPKEMDRDDRDVEAVTTALCATTISDDESEDGGDYMRILKEEGAVGGEVARKIHKCQLNNSLLGGENVLPTRRSQKGVNLYVKNLHQGFGDEHLRKEFSPFGIITSAKVMTDELGKSRGFGFVSFTHPLEASRAIAELNGKLVFNKPIYVGLAQCREDRRIQLATQFMHRLKFNTNSFTDHKRGTIRGRGAGLSNGYVPRGRDSSTWQAEREPRWEVPRPRAPFAPRFDRPPRHPLFSQASRNYHLPPRFGEPPVGLTPQDPCRREPESE